MPLERLSSNDLTTLATDAGQVPMNIAVVLEFGSVTDAAAVVDTLARRLRQIPRMRQRLLRPRFGGGAPLWVDDADFEVLHHVGESDLSPAVLVCRRLDPRRPLWAFYWTAVGEQLRVVIVVHHVVADGMGGLAALSALVDGVEPPPPKPALLPDRRRLRRDAHHRRMAALRNLPGAVAEVVAGAREMGLTASRPALVPRSSILQPTSNRRALRVLEADVAAVVEAAHQRGVSVNDLILAAVAGCIEKLLAARGEVPPEVVISVPVSARSQTADLGNSVGAVPVAIPTGLNREQRLAVVHRTMNRAKAEQRGSSAIVLSVVFRALAKLAVGQYFVNHQRLIHTFETNLRGPAVEVTMAGVPLRRMLPIAVNPGNVGVSFDVLSYAGRLTISVVACPITVPEIDRVAQALGDELTAFTGRSSQLRGL